MRHNINLLLPFVAIAITISCSGPSASTVGSTPEIEKRIDKLLSQMTLQEKIGQMNQISAGGSVEPFAEAVRNGQVGSILNETDPGRVNELQRIAVEESRLGIPILIARDVIHGFNTVFPIPLGIAATFDPQLAEEGARVAAIEATSVGVRWTFSPMLDIARDPRWGRIAEGSGEDPYLDARMGEALVRGYQGEPGDSTSMAACIKHFVGYGAAEGGRDYNSTYLTERQLRNVYLPPFEAGVKAGAMTLMTSFNDNDGVPSTGNRFIVNDILRDEWGYDGLVVTDWNSMGEMMVHGFAADHKNSAALAIGAGVDMDMMTYGFIANLEALVKEGKVSEKQIDAAVRNILRKAEFASGKEPDIFVIEGPTGYELYKDKIADMTGAEWTQYTAAAYMDGDKVVGFPVAVEGYGMAYNADILEKAGIDPATLTNVDAYAAAFEKLDSMKDELGLTAVVSMTASTAAGMTWVTGLHNFNVYLTVGLDRNDTSVIDKVLEGEVIEDRFHDYCEYVALIFKYSDPEMLLNGTQDMQLAAFANGQTAFYHQGNWMDPNIVALGVEFPMAYAPHAFLHEDTDGILVNAPSWYVVNQNAGNADEAIEFLNALATTDLGHDYMVNKAAMVPAFTNVTLEPATPLSKSVMEWNAAGKTYSWQQYKLPDGFGMGTLGAIYELLASGAVDEPTFEQMMKDAIATIPTL